MYSVLKWCRDCFLTFNWGADVWISCMQSKVNENDAIFFYLKLFLCVYRTRRHTSFVPVAMSKVVWFLFTVNINRMWIVLNLLTVILVLFHASLRSIRIDRNCERFNFFSTKFMKLPIPILFTIYSYCIVPFKSSPKKIDFHFKMRHQKIVSHISDGMFYSSFGFTHQTIRQQNETELKWYLAALPLCSVIPCDLNLCYVSIRICQHEILY